MTSRGSEPGVDKRGGFLDRDGTSGAVGGGSGGGGGGGCDPFVAIAGRELDRGGRCGAGPLEGGGCDWFVVVADAFGPLVTIAGGSSGGPFTGAVAGSEPDVDKRGGFIDRGGRCGAGAVGGGGGG